MIFWAIFAQKIAVMKAKYFWKVLKNRSNEIHTNEIRIRQEPPVLSKSTRCQLLNYSIYTSFVAGLTCPLLEIIRLTYLSKIGTE